MKELIRRPMVGISLCFLAGIWVGLTFPIPAGLPLGTALLGILVLFVELVYATKQRFSPNSFSVTASVAVGITVLALACLHALLMLRIAIPLDTHWMAQAESQVIQIGGVISDDPVPVLTADKRTIVWKFPCRVTGFRSDTNAAMRAVEGVVQVQWIAPAAGRRPRYGDQWQLTGRLMAIPAKVRNPATHLRGFRADWSDSCFLSTGHGNRFLARCYEARYAAAQRLAYGIADQPAEITTIHSLLLGYRNQMPYDTYRAFAATGTVHIFAISGSHVVVIAEIFVALLMACGVSRVNWIVFLAPLLIGFTVSTGMEPSALRACIMAVVYWSAPRLHRRSDIYSAMGLSAILILLVDPTDLFNLGFILSFSAVLGLVMLYPVCAWPFKRLLATDPLRLQPESLARRALRSAGSALAQLLAASGAAWLVSAPLTAYYFEQFSPIALLGNLVALPLSAVIMLTGCLTLILGPAAPWLAEIFNHANAVLAALLVWTMKFFAAVPGGHFIVPAPPLWSIAAFYLLLGILVWIVGRKERVVPQGDLEE